MTRLKWGMVAGLLCLLMSSGPVLAQPYYSIDEQGPTAGVFDPGGVAIDGASILTPTTLVGPPPTPTVVIPSAGVGGLGILPTALGFSELDALSFGTDTVLSNNERHFYYFSVDEFAIGIPGAPIPPNVTTEGAAGLMEASADVYVYPPAIGIPTPPPPFAPIPPALAIGNTGVYDGNGGLTPFSSPTLNLVEANPPSPGTLMGPDAGDNLDALEIDGTFGGPGFFGVYFSLDAAFADPLEVPPAGFPPPNTGTAAANGFFGGDVLLTTAPGGPPAMYAPALSLGLGPMDDLDALILNDLTDGLLGGYTPTTGPYSWLGGTDMLLYSLRRGSATIGTADALFGAPIEEGDILIPVFSTASGTFSPGIWIPAEALGLATVRSGTAALYAGFPNPDYPGLSVWADDLNALDVSLVFIPEPASFVLLGIGWLALVRRRKSLPVHSNTC